MSSSCFDVAIIGAGVSGIYATYCCGISGLNCCVIDSLSCPGGQCTTFYPDKNVYGVPGMSDMKTSDFIDLLKKQAAPFSTRDFFSHKITEIKKDCDNKTFCLLSNSDDVIYSKNIVLACGIGEMIPNTPSNIKGISSMQDSPFIQYYCMKLDLYKNKDVIIAGGGDSAADFAINIGTIARKIILIHRRDKLTCDHDKLLKLQDLESKGVLEFKLSCNIIELNSSKSVITDMGEFQADYIVFCYGFRATPSNILGLKEMGVETENNLIKVDINSMQTHAENIYAIGDAIIYPNKKKNIVSCFFEADRAIRSIKRSINSM